MRRRKYERLREQYPEYVSLDQLAKICRIAKRSAKYLVDHGIIPYQDTGKQTWKYRIAIDDVITYLHRREQVGSMIPRRATVSKESSTGRVQSTRICFSQLVEPGQESEIVEYFNFIYDDCGDVLTTVEIAEMTGLDKSTVAKLLKTGVIKYFQKDPKYLVLKKHLMQFVVTRRFIEYRTNSEHFKKIVGGFEIWKNAKSLR